jgi:hypothetical protein
MVRRHLVSLDLATYLRGKPDHWTSELSESAKLSLRRYTTVDGATTAVRVSACRTVQWQVIVRFARDMTLRSLARSRRIDGVAAQ